MTFHAMTEHYEEITVCGKPALFTSIRIRRDTIPDGLYAYDVRHDDECRGIPCEIAPFVMVNHWGTIILAEPLELPNLSLIHICLVHHEQKAEVCRFCADVCIDVFYKL